MTSRLSVVRIREGATLPTYATEGAAGLDLSACLDESLAIAPGDRVMVRTGLVIALPSGHEGQVRPRSGLALRHGLTVLNAPGTIDEDYRGEVCVILVNLGRESVRIAHGDRIAQLVVAPVTRVACDEVASVESLSSTTRGTDGFGSTGR